jgi:ADP-heptose:LPS heptosyltransferase
VGISEIWPELHQVGQAPIAGPYWVCASFANGGGKDYPVEGWAALFQSLHRKGIIPTLVLTGSTGQAVQLADFRDTIVKHAPELAPRIRILHPSNLQEFIDLWWAAYRKRNGMPYVPPNRAADFAAAKRLGQMPPSPG